MALRNLHADVKAALVNNTPVQVYHLIKFEKPSETTLLRSQRGMILFI